MTNQDQFWSRAARCYETEFVDPYRPDVRSPLGEELRRLADPKSKTVADLGCGIGPLLPLLAEHFHQVFAVDFAEGMLQRARQRCRALDNIIFLQRSLTDLAPLHGQLDVAIAINSLVLPAIPELEECLRQIRASLRPGGVLLAIVPAMDAVHYHTMLLLDRALAAGKPLPAARKNAAHFGDHACFDFAFGQFCYRGLEQHFWQPFEIDYRLRRAGFRRVRKAPVRLSWEQLACGDSLKDLPPPWDWLVRAEVKDSVSAKR
jgi:SAM-dependent methyltransferase